MSQFGTNLRLTIFGQSHSAAIGMTLDGLPAGESVDIEALTRFAARRAPGGRLSTQRKESDTPEFLSGLYQGKTCGAPLAALIRNTDCRSKDYEAIADKPRPSHADWPAQVKYRGFQDIRGGGAFSGRLTAPIVLAGGIAVQILERRGIRVAAHLLSLGTIQDRPFADHGEKPDVLDERLSRLIPVLSDEVADAMASQIESVRKEGDSIGGVIECMAQGMPVGVGGPLFDGLDGRLAQALFGIPGVKGVEMGLGFELARTLGSEANDGYRMEDGEVTLSSNRSGGIAGGMSTGAPILFKVAMKPTPSIAKVQKTISLSTGTDADLSIHGRHDPTIAVRAVPVVEAVTALCLLDALLGSPAVVGENGFNL